MGRLPCSRAVRYLLHLTRKRNVCDAWSENNFGFRPVTFAFDKTRPCSIPGVTQVLQVWRVGVGDGRI